MGKRKQSIPQRATEEKRKCQTWNMLDGNDKGSVSVIPDNDPSLQNEVTATQAEEQQTTCAVNAPNKSLHMQDVYDLYIESSLFHIFVHKQMTIKDDAWSCVLAEFSVKFSEESDTFLPPNELPENNVFSLHIRDEKDKCIFSYDLGQSSQTPSKKKGKIKAVEKDIRFCFVAVDLPLECLAALRCRSFQVVLDRYDAEAMTMVMKVMGTESVLTRLSHPSEAIRLKSVNQSLLILMDHFYKISAQDLEELSYSRKHDIDEIYATIKHRHTLDLRPILAGVQHEDLLPTLRLYQQAAITWMLYKEKHSITHTDSIHMLYTEIITKDGQTLYYNRYGGVLIRDRPVWAPSSPGGILGDEMGLGKTVEVLGCILHHPRACIPDPPALPIVQDEDVPEKRRKKRKVKGKDEVATIIHEESDTDTVIYTDFNKSEESGKPSTSSEDLHRSADSNDQEKSGEENDTLKSENDFDNSEGPHKPSTELEDQNRSAKSNDHKESENLDEQITELEDPHKFAKSNVGDQEMEVTDGITDDAIVTVSHPRKSVFAPKLVCQREEFACICGTLDTYMRGKGKKRKHAVQCVICHLWQHAECVNYDLKDPLRGEFKCPHCHVASRPIPSGATLIISPSSIAHQWVDEILKHVAKKSLNVMMYQGVNKQGFIQPQTLARQDIVITTYETLRKELDYVDLPHSNSDTGRQLRHPKRFMALPSPIIAVEWWRICLDEAQMVECTTTKTAEMALRLTAVNRWCVTGTPIQKGIDDLYGLMLFLGVDPYWVLQWWNKLVYDPFCHGVREPMYDLLTSVLWRTVKSDVLDQINIPAQSEHLQWLTFSPVEEHFYRKQHGDCVRLSMERLSKWTDSSIKLSSLDRHTVNQLLYPLVRLRQACCHPQAVRGEFIAIQKSTLTMEELLESLTKKARLEAEESHRAYVAAINGEAGLHIIQDEVHVVLLATCQNSLGQGLTPVRKMEEGTLRAMRVDGIVNMLKQNLHLEKLVHMETHSEHNRTEIDTDDEVAVVKECSNMLKTYREKVEHQNEKYILSLTETEDQDIETIMDEDYNLCDESLKCSQKMDIYLDSLTSDIKEIDIKETTRVEKVTELQERMQMFMINQSKRQQEFAEWQSQKQFELSEKQMAEQNKIVEKLTAPKEPSVTVKLPTIELRSFNGDKLKWPEFWDSFECAVHQNKRLSEVEKFNYLQTKLVGEAKSAISGLSLCNKNYNIAVSLLQERFGRKQDIIDVHYQMLMNIAQPSSKTESLRCFLDTSEKHLCSLEVLGEDIRQNMFMSIIKSKLPQEVLLQLEIQKGASKEWSVEELREGLRSYIIAREHAEQNINIKQYNENDNDNGSVKSSFKRNIASNYKWNEKRQTSAETLISTESQNSSFSNKCRYCAHPHWSDECTNYRTIAERKRVLKGACYKCLKVGHSSVECRLNRMCVHCGERDSHHRSLCPKKFATNKPFRQESVNVSEETQDEIEDNEVNQENVLISSGESVLMQTATTEAKGPSNLDSKRIRLLLDTGSQRTYVTERLANTLGLVKGDHQEIKLVTFGCDKPKVIKTPSTKLEIKMNNGEYMTINANIVPDITGTIERKAVHLPRSEGVQHILKSVELADTIPLSNEYSTVDVLIGNDYYLDIVLPQRIEIQPGLYLLSSKFGWLLTGRTHQNQQPSSDLDTNMLILTYGSSITESSSFTSIDSVLPRKPDLEDFWSLESIGIKDNENNSEDEAAMHKFRKTLKFENGRYQATWPWKEEIPDLPVNRGLAYGRLKSTVARMRDKPDLLKQYDSVIKDQMDKGVIEKVSGAVNGGVVHFLPHHAVITPAKTTTKLRLVYDASAKTSQNYKSLNECLYRGPVMLHDLCGMLIRFRTHNIAIVADIEKAFLQVGLQPDQRDATRFLWLKDLHNSSTEHENIQEYRFCRIPFGVISSPFILGATIDCHLDSYNNQIANRIKKDIYVDNVITGTNTESEAIDMYTSSKQMFKDAAMNLREWSTNSEVVKNIIPLEDQANNSTIKVLGLVWDTKTDTLSLKESQDLKKTTRTTKREVLKQLASVYDPLGLLCPLVLPGKVLMQDLWNKHLDWDDELKPDDVIVWNTIKNELLKISCITIPRGISIKENTDVKYNLICFCDASVKAYATAIYLHQEGENETKSDLIFAKSRLTPIKQVTIPRLELMAVVIGVRCLQFVKENLDLQIENVYIWSDSQCVLQWITLENSTQIFVKNRVKEIKKHAISGFHYISSKENPADVASRGTVVEKLDGQELWFHGPDWLIKPKSEWKTEFIEKTSDTDISETEQMCEITECSNDIPNDETKKDKSVSHSADEIPPFGIESESYSSASRLLRVTAFAHRFINKTRKKSTENGTLTREELDEAEHLVIAYIQRKHYGDVIKAIKEGKQNNVQRQLGLYLDNSGILRCGGRLDNAELSEAARHPIFLPKQNRFTHLMIERSHKEILHSGVSQTLSRICYKYWIPSGRATVKRVLRQCLVCRRHEGGAYKMPIMPPLPKARVSAAPPFSKVGLDYLGPLYVKGTDTTDKVWICLFTCLVTRAVHLELMHNLSTEEFLMGLRRFIATRGKPDEVISDNATQFKLANQTLDIVWKRVLRCLDVQNYASESGIKWTFIVELAPWMGGFYERLVGLVKRSLRKAIGRTLLSEVQMQTVVKEVESVVNARPITYVGDDINSMITLSPSYFLSLNPKTGIPETEIDSDEDYIRGDKSAEKIFQIWKKGQKILNTFWKVWRDEYLLSLRERTQMCLKTRRIQSKSVPCIGDVVLIKEDVPRGCWKLGKITNLIVSRDGEHRSAKVKTQSGRVIGRPLNLLYPIEVSGNIDQSPGKNLEQRTKVSRPPKRAAAERANEKMKVLFDESIN